MKGKRHPTQFPIARLLRRSLPGVTLACLLLVLSTPSLASEDTQKRDVAVAAAPEKRVLFIHTNKSNGPGVILYDKTFQAALSGDPSQQITLYNEYTDLWHFVGEDYARTLNDFYQQKYAGQHFDLIVVESPPALKFLLAYGDELFPGTPVVFCVTEGRLIESLSLKSNFTGVLEGLDYKKSLESALRLQPDTRRVVVVSGTAPIDQSFLASARSEFQKFEGQVEFTYLADLPLEEIERRVSELPEHNIVFYVTLFRDSTGHAFPPAESAARIGKAANAPLYSVSEVYSTPAGGVGGYLWSIDADAMEAAKIARRILAGAKPQDLPIHVGDTNRYIFDWRQLRRWGIDEQRLPPGSILRFKEPSIWEQYKWRIVGLGALCLLEALLIVGLLLNRSRRRQAEKENERLARLAEAERRHLDEVVSNVPGIVWEGRSVPGTNTLKASFVSEYVEKMLGYSVEEWLATPGFALTIIPEEDRDRATREAQALFESGKEGVLQFRWVTKDGRILWVESQVAAICDEAGKPIGLRGVTLDITDRRRAEEDLRGSEERFAKAFKANPQPMSITRLADGYYLDVNESFLSMSGYTREEVVDRTSLELGIWDTPGARSEFMKLLKERGAIRNLETKFRTKSGSFRLLLSSAEEFELGGEHCVLVASSDITERNRAVEKLRQSEERFRSMADTAPVLIWISGPDKLCTYFNRGWLEFTGRTMEQELGNGWAEGVYSEDYARSLEIYNSAFDRKEPFRMEYRLRRADGQFGWIYDSGTPRFSSDGEFLGYIGSCIDISDRKRAEETLRDLGGRLINAQEEERSRVARELHDDLSQRIAVLSIGLEQVGQQLPEGPDNLHARMHSLWVETQEVSTELHRLSYQLHPSKLDHLGLVAAVRSFCEELAANHEVNIKFRQQGFPAALSKDITLCLFRIAQESLRNAVRHSGAREAQVVLEKTDQAVRLLISDTGCGFDTDSSKMTSGLGFISIRERLRLVGGQLSIRSRPFQGTQIEVIVPLMKRPEHASVGSSGQSTIQSRTGGTIDKSSQVQ